jgi:DNA-binding GntR family transcriptional regulator
MALSRPMLRDRIKDAILARILDGSYAPGERIVEIRVAQEFGVSQAPVREALRELELLRLVVSEPFRGARVREVTAQELAEIYPVRAALEEVAARGAVAGFDGDVSELGAELDGMRRAARTGDIHAFVDHDVAFHRRIVVASGNGTLLELWASLHVDLRTTITLIKRAADLGDVAEAHVPVMEALRGGDPERAAVVLRTHIESFSHWAREPDAD